MALEIVRHPPWAGLRPELLDEIAKHIPSPHDYVMLRAVCKSWHMALPKISKHIRCPWLVLPFDDETLKTHKKEPYHLRLPELQDTQIRGSCFGCLITVGIGGELLVFNPFTSSYFLLPPLSTFPGVVSYQPHNHGHEYSLRHKDRDSPIHTLDSIRIQKYYVVKIVLSSSPEEEGFMAVAIYGEYFQLAFCRSGDDKWTDFPTIDVTSHFGYHDVIFHKGKIYAVDGNAYFYEFDIKTLHGGVNKVKRPPSSDSNLNKSEGGGRVMSRYCIMDNKYLVWNPDGNYLLIVVRQFHFYRNRKVCNGEEVIEDCYRTSRFDVFKLDESAKRWCREFSLGDYVLVVGYNSSIWKPPFEDREGNCVRNCIYYTDNMLRYDKKKKVIWGTDIGVFDLKDGSIKNLSPNSSDFLCPAPVWV